MTTELFVFVIVTVALLITALRNGGPLRYVLLISAAFTLVTGVMNLETTEGTPLWLAFYFALATAFFVFLPWFAVFYGWRWSEQRHLAIKLLVRACTSALIIVLLYLFIVLPVASSIFDTCLVPLVEWEGNCAYKPL